MSILLLLDTGPLVAAVNQRDQWHDWACQQFGQARPPLLTCEAVFSESWFLLRRTDHGCQSLIDMIDKGVVEVAFSACDHLTRIVQLMRRYANVPMSVADACLVRMAEITPDSTVLTLDGDFRVYRRDRRKRIPLLIPGDR